MQLQIEHVCSQSVAQSCVICSQLFQPNLARVVLYIDDEAQGDLCPTCLTQGASYIRTQIQTIPVSDRISSYAA
ncbi:hypothetical protein ACQ4M3_37710 [Leptolyngbya sp. AN03gr2]|uniref:hypothetical protein n=1 Tax=unclassified Leptolyngbya TaxID=2650499 RepID=UPI003D31A913